MFTLSCIDNDSRLQPPVGVWTVSQFQCGWSSSQTSYPWALVSLYLTNKLIGYGLISLRQVRRSPPLYKKLCSFWTHPVLIIVSDGYPKQRGKLPIYYSPVRRSHNKFLSRKIEKNWSRSTCMPNPRRQRSFWARIKLSIKFKLIGYNPKLYFAI